jgi:hypothetical protein
MEMVGSYIAMELFYETARNFNTDRIQETVIREIEQNQLTWYGHVQRMVEGRLPKRALKWMPKQKRARGRPKKNWMEGLKKAMNERNLSEGPWDERKKWSLGVGKRRKTF